MSDPTQQVRAAVYAKLVASPPVFTGPAGTTPLPIYSRAPDNAEPPYLLIDRVALEPALTKGGRAWPVSVDLQTVTSDRSPALCENLMAQVVTLLHAQPITGTGVSIFPLRLADSSADPDPDRLLYFGRQTFRTTAQT
jgi:hypothetical protein